jgi:hypothetical protein
MQSCQTIAFLIAVSSNPNQGHIYVQRTSGLKSESFQSKRTYHKQWRDVLQALMSLPLQSPRNSIDCASLWMEPMRDHAASERPEFCMATPVSKRASMVVRDGNSSHSARPNELVALSTNSMLVIPSKSRRGTTVLRSSAFST